MDPVCAACHEPLLVEIEADSDIEDGGSSSNNKAVASHESVSDDVELPCGCHYHWECFMDSYTITQCPTCTKDISSLSPLSGQQQVLCTVRNEGGEQTNYDILPSATEEAYLRAYPEERKGHAFLEFCREGDIDAIVHLIKDDIETSSDSDDDDNDEEVNGDDDNNEIDVLRYQGTFEGIEGTGLHVAIRHQREEIAWLMLALASSLEWSSFPPHLLTAMEGVGLSRADRKPGRDVRGLVDGSGRTPLAVAKEVGGLWGRWIEEGILSA